MGSKVIMFLFLGLIAAACSPMRRNDSHVKNTLSGVLEADAANELFTATRGLDARKVQTLLSDGVSPNVRNDLGLTPIHYASVLGDVNLVRILLSAGSSLGSPRNSLHPAVIHLAAQGGHVEVLKFLLSQGADLNSVWLLNGHTPLLEATFNGNVEVVQYLLSVGADSSAVTLRGLTASDLAAREAVRNPAMKTILDKLNEHHVRLGLVPDSTGKVDFSADQKSKNLAALLNIIDPPKDVSAADQEREKTVQSLLTAAEKGDLELVKEITSRNQIDLNVTHGRLGTTPLILASVGGHSTVVQYLLDTGADPNVREIHPMGISALFKAAVFGHVEIVKILLAAGANVNEQGKANGLSPLHDAVLRGRAEVAKLLLENGANAESKSHAGRTAKDLARGRPELEGLFSP
ncbi:MAG: ankyrin repeat domain-containing protein [Proteobacteria bacterium]|nr:ankyrin repeat domain-containing protein [Pseudomonadota bacterium]